MRKPRIKINYELEFGNYEDARINRRLKKGRITSKVAIKLICNFGGVDNV